jgi:hypothetical protein
LPIVGLEKLLTALSLGQQSPTKTHISPLTPTIVKKIRACKRFFAIFPLWDNDLANFAAKKLVV